MSFRFAIRGLKKAQQRNFKHVRDLRLGTSVNKAVRWGATAAHRAAITSTPWDTSALRNSHRIKMKPSQQRAFIHIGSGANPRGQRMSEYGPHLHRQGLIPGRRGGIRAFYEYTVLKYGRQISQGMARFFIGRFKR